jgi:hypothetical protein
METQRKGKHKHCGLCRQPNHNVRKCPQIDILDAQNLEAIQLFLIENGVFSMYEGLRYRFSWLLGKDLIELRALSRKHNLAYELMDKRDMYRALKRIYVQNSLRNIEDEFFSNFTFRSADSRSDIFHLLSTISYIEFFINDYEEIVREPLVYVFESSDFSGENEQISDCPVCYENVTSENAVQFNCKHALCNGCFSKYNLILERDSLNVPTCPICRTTIHTLKGNLETLRSNYRETPNFFK